jgi:hypothetical protein
MDKQRRIEKGSKWRCFGGQVFGPHCPEWIDGKLPNKGFKGNTTAKPIRFGRSDKKIGGRGIGLGRDVHSGGTLDAAIRSSRDGGAQVSGGTSTRDPWPFRRPDGGIKRGLGHSDRMGKDGK